MFWALWVGCGPPRDDLFAWYWFGEGSVTTTLHDASDPAYEGSWTAAGTPESYLEGYLPTAGSPLVGMMSEARHPVDWLAADEGFGAAVGQHLQLSLPDSVWLLAYADVAGSAWAESPCGSPVTGLATELLVSSESSVGVSFRETGGRGVDPVAAAIVEVGEHLTDDSPWTGALSLGPLVFDGAGLDCAGGAWTAEVDIAWSFADDPVYVHHATGGLF